MLLAWVVNNHQKLQKFWFWAGFSFRLLNFFIPAKFLRKNVIFLKYLFDSDAASRRCNNRRDCIKIYCRMMFEVSFKCCFKVKILAGTGFRTCDLPTQIKWLGHQPALGHFCYNPQTNRGTSNRKPLTSRGPPESLAATSGQSQSRPRAGTSGRVYVQLLPTNKLLLQSFHFFETLWWCSRRFRTTTESVLVVRLFSPTSQPEL